VKSTAGTEALVALEDDPPAALHATLPGTDLPLWPLLRWPLAREMAVTELDAVNVPVRLTRAQLALRAIDALVPSRGTAPLAPRGRRALFVVPGKRVTRTASGLMDQLVGDHAALLGDDAVIVRDAPLPPWTPPAERPGPTRTLSLDGEIFRSELAARFRPPSDTQLAEARAIAEELAGRLDFPLGEREREKAVRSLLVRFRRLAAMRSAYDRLLDRVEPRVLFVQQAAYGDRVPLIVAAHRRGIHVAEHQHGFVGPSHAAYNYGAAMAEGELRRALPDTLLTFGEFWSEAVRVPFDTYAVGKPPIDALRQAAAPAAERARRLVLVAGVYERERTAAAALRIRDALPADWELVFRPHPSERATVAERYPEVVARAGITVDTEPDALVSMSAARAVAGVASTTLYEALAIGCQVIVRDNPRYTDIWIDRGLFPLIVDDGEGLSRAVGDLAAGATPQLPTAEIDRIWQPGSLERFRTFAERF
jgi:hypothetical protein